MEVSLRETDVMRRLREETYRLSSRDLASAPEQSQFLALLMKLVDAKRHRGGHLHGLHDVGDGVCAAGGRQAAGLRCQRRVYLGAALLARGGMAERSTCAWLALER